MPWDPNLYHKFQAERSAPFFDLLRLVEVRPNLKVVDLGCGTGDLTRKLADALPNSSVLGLDSSPQMLEKAQSFSTRSEEHTSELQSPCNLVCRLLLEKKKN